MSVVKVGDVNGSEVMDCEQKYAKLGGHGCLDSSVAQAIGKDPLFSFSPSTDSSPIQWIQLLHAFDQHENNKAYKSSGVENVEGCLSRNHRSEVGSLTSDRNGIRDCNMKENGGLRRMTNNSNGSVQSSKFPEAVAALAQAAAKTNGETEKYIPGWPFLSPSKAPLKKCDKCSREFCSAVNYRRHVRMHRRSFHHHKVSRELLASYWDTTSVDKQKELLSYNDVDLEGVGGSSIIKALTSLIRRPGFTSLPHNYVKAGTILLDLLQANPARLPMPSEEFFSVLDEASEKTFLCAGTAVTLQKFVFDGEVGKVALDAKNVVACTSFFVEQKLVNAWVAEKEAEALRCQKLLMDEEEEAQRRQADTLERKRQKKLKQKKQKAKDNDHRYDAASKVDMIDLQESAEMPCELVPLQHGQNISEAPVGSTEPTESTPLSSVSAITGLECVVEAADGLCKYQRAQHGDVQRQAVTTQHTTYKSRNASKSLQSVQAPSVMPMTMKMSSKESRASSLLTGQIIWTRKTKSTVEKGINGAEKVEETHQKSDQTDDCAVLIGSIPIPLGSSERELGGKDSSVEKQIKQDSSLNGVSRSTMKLWRPVSRQGREDSSTVQRLNKQIQVNEEVAKHILPEEDVPSDITENDNSVVMKDLDAVLGHYKFSVPQCFSSQAAKAFLAQRWKEAIASEDVVILKLPNRPTDDTEIPENNRDEEKSKQPDSSGRTILSKADNYMGVAGTNDVVTSVSKHKFKTKSEKNVRVVYIPKQRNNATERS